MRKGANQCDTDDGERRGQVSIETRAGPSKEGIISPKAAKGMVRPPGLEPGTAGLEIRCSIQLSYGRDLAAAQSLALRGRGEVV